MAGFGDIPATDETAFQYMRGGYANTGGVRIECGCFSWNAGTLQKATNLTTLFCGFAFSEGTDNVNEIDARNAAKAKSICDGGLIDWSINDTTEGGTPMMNYIVFGI